MDRCCQALVSRFLWFPNWKPWIPLVLTNYTVEDLLIANKTVKKLKADQKSGIFFPEIGDFEDLKFDLYCDTAHANLPDGSSSCQGHIILLSRSERCCPLTWSSHKMKRVVQISLSAETLAMLNSLDEANIFKQFVI